MRIAICKIELPAEGDLLEIVYRDGVLLRDQTFAEVRALSEERLLTWTSPL